MIPAIGAVPNVVNRLYWLACSSWSGGTRLGTEASLAAVQNSATEAAANWTREIQVGGLPKGGGGGARVREGGGGGARRSRDERAGPARSPALLWSPRPPGPAPPPASGPRTSAG